MLEKEATVMELLFEQYLENRKLGDLSAHGLKKKEKTEIVRKRKFEPENFISQHFRAGYRPKRYIIYTSYAFLCFCF